MKRVRDKVLSFKSRRNGAKWFRNDLEQRRATESPRELFQRKKL